MYIISPLSGCNSGFAKPLVKAILSTVSEPVDEGVPVTLEFAPVITFAPENAVALPDASTP